MSSAGRREREDHDRHLTKCGSEGSGSFLLAVWSQRRCGLPVLHRLRRRDARRSSTGTTTSSGTTTTTPPFQSRGTSHRMNVVAIGRDTEGDS